MERSLRDALAEVEDTHWWFAGRREILRRLLQQHRARGPLLEVGCGTGANLRMLAEFGAVTGIEPDQTDRERAVGRKTGTVLEGALPDRIPGDETYGTVLALDVIEHVEDDVAAVEALCGKLRPGGHLVLTVPAYQWMWSEHDRVNGHFRRYSRDQLATLLHREGVRPEKLSYFNSALLPLVAGVRTVGRLIGRDGSGTGLPPAPVNAALLKLLASEARLLSRFNLPAGVSLVAIARRS